MVTHYGTRWGQGLEREWQGTYDYLCTVTHPTLAALEFIELDTTGLPHFNEVDEFRERLVRSAIAPYLKALEHFAAFCSWDDEPIKNLYDSIGAVLSGFSS